MSVVVLTEKGKFGPYFRSFQTIATLEEKNRAARELALSVLGEPRQGPAKDESGNFTPAFTEHAKRSAEASIKHQDIKKELDGRITEIKLALDNDKEFAELHARIHSVYAFSSWPIVNILLEIPMDLLVIILALMMGGVGGILSILVIRMETGYYVSEADMITKPIIGIFAALAILILFKAGQLAVTPLIGATPTSGNAENPFIVAFLGLIAGLLSRQALAKVISAGATIFGPSGYQAKSELALKINALSEDQKTMLFRITDLSKNEIEQILERKKDVEKDTALIVASVAGERMAAMFEPKR